jgi:hypothetical protein
MLRGLAGRQVRQQRALPRKYVVTRAALRPGFLRQCPQALKMLVITEQFVLPRACGAFDTLGDPADRARSERMNRVLQQPDKVAA